MNSIADENVLRRDGVPMHSVQFSIGRRAKHCVVIPVVNEGGRIRSLVAEMDRLGITRDFDVLVVDGGSTDGSLSEHWLLDSGVRALIRVKGTARLSGQLRCAYAFALQAGYEGIITIDGNNKDDPSAIRVLSERLLSGSDFVQASRFVEGGRGINTPLLRHFAIRLIHAPLLSLCSGQRWTDTTQGFRGYSAKALEDQNVDIFRDVFSGYALLAYLSYRLPRLGYKCEEVPSTRRYPKGKLPTKISGVVGMWEVFDVLLRACSGRYNPERNLRNSKAA